jgi:hypothetical protein
LLQAQIVYNSRQGENDVLGETIMNIFFGEEKDSKRTLGVRDRQILYRNAGGRCENPTCNKKIDYDEMEVGHKKAHSKGGVTSLAESKCLCHRCNKLQGTDSWAAFMRKQKVPTKSTIAKELVISKKPTKTKPGKKSTPKKKDEIDSIIEKWIG